MRLTQTIAGHTFSGEVTPLPGCPDVAVSHAVYSHSGKGTGQAKVANALRNAQVWGLGYSCLLCTVDEENVAQIKVLTSNLWRECGRFNNRRTGHTVVIFMKELT
jgi:L-amino acid N-acyltransferase YncA